ncbi:Rieske (2Fe-2S) protein [Capillimicrobium parvum]|uniref:Rieske domain-containing protein n=1 Tax=Capillimicrobium parvum TaxID=2884022 RepID=A0A9E6XZL7_9ACTN|nr:Rieske (2Fe-2S) protein [Capillimicrobium parvum]UGS37309.1 hypothetical protein DSM104329_03724 [Capillimicrobium parvum]
MTDHWTELELLDEPSDDEVLGARAGDRALVAVRHQGAWRVFADRCTHAECAFTDYAEVVAEDGVIVCNCHGAEFRLADGSVALEPAEIPLTLLEVRERDDRLEVRLD